MKKLLLLACLASICLAPVLHAEGDTESWGSRELTSEESLYDDAIALARAEDKQPEAIKAILSEGVTVKSDGDLQAAGILLEPYRQHVCYVDGWLAHIGHYPSGKLITFLEGPRVGCQLTTDRCGFVRTVNCCSEVVYTHHGKFLRHFYPDCHVTTGFDQRVHWY